MALPHGVVGWQAVCDCGIIYFYIRVTAHIVPVKVVSISVYVSV